MTLTARVNEAKRPVYMYRLRVCHGLLQIYIVCIVTDRLSSIPILSIKQSVSIDTMVNFFGNSDGHWDGTCKQALTINELNRHMYVVVYGFQFTMENRVHLLIVTNELRSMNRFTK